MQRERMRCQCVMPCACNEGLDAPSKSFRKFHASGMAAAASDIAFPVRIVTVELLPCYRGLCVKTLSSS